MHEFLLCRFCVYIAMATLTLADKLLYTAQNTHPRQETHGSK